MKAILLVLCLFLAYSASAQLPFSMPTYNEPGDPGFGMGTTTTKAFSVYPNPSNGQLTVVFDAIKATQFAIFVYNVQKQMVSKTFVGDASGQTSIRLNLQHLPAGNYFVAVLNGTNVLAKTQIRIN